MDIMNVGLKENSRDMCPRCYRSVIGDESEIATKEVGGDSQYICTKEHCIHDNGDEVQFFVNNDQKKSFPYDQIFPDRELSEFYTKKYVT